MGSLSERYKMPVISSAIVELSNGIVLLLEYRGYGVFVECSIYPRKVLFPRYCSIDDALKSFSSTWDAFGIRVIEIILSVQ